MESSFCHAPYYYGIIAIGNTFIKFRLCFPGYIILYTTNSTKRDREWSVKAIKGEKHSEIVTDLNSLTNYYFKIQARNSRGNGPFSQIVAFRTGESKKKISFTYDILQ